MKKFFVITILLLFAANPALAYKFGHRLGRLRYPLAPATTASETFDVYAAWYHSAKNGLNYSNDKWLDASGNNLTLTRTLGVITTSERGVEFTPDASLKGTINRQPVCSVVVHFYTDTTGTTASYLTSTTGGSYGISMCCSIWQSRAGLRDPDNFTSSVLSWTLGTRAYTYVTVFNGSNTTQYLDGVKVVGPVDQSSPSTGSVTFYAGSYGGDYGFAGAIDGIVIVNHAMTQTEAAMASNWF